MLEKEWIFPHSTCESNFKNFPIKQPWSFGVNMINAGLLTRNALLTETRESKLAMLSFALFELLHMISHAIHLDRNIHEISIHACGYLMAFTTYNTLRNETKKELNYYNVISILIMTIIDIVTFISVRNIYSIATGLSVLAVTVIQYLPYVSKKKQNIMKSLITGTFLLFLMFVVEKKYCGYFQSIHFEYHPIIIETWGLFLFQLLASFLTNTSSTKQLKNEF